MNLSEKSFLKKNQILELKSKIASFCELDAQELKENYFHLNLRQLRQVARRNPQKCQQLIPYLLKDLSNNNNNKDFIIIAQCIKYLCKNPSFKSKDRQYLLEQLNSIGNKCQNRYVKSEICLTVGFILQSDNKIISSLPETAQQQLKFLLKNEMNPESLSSLQHIFTEDSSELVGQKEKQKERKKIYYPAFDKKQKRVGPKCEITKTQQIIKNQSNSANSQEEVVQILNLQQSLSKSRKKEQQVENQKVEFIKDKRGTDTIWHNSTYQDVKQIYQLAKQGKEIKQEDKDKFLPNRFIGLSKKFTSYRIGNLDLSSSLFIDIMISQIFKIISEIGQKLNEESIDEIMVCLSSRDNLKSMMFNKKDEKHIAQGLTSLFIVEESYSSDPEIVKNIASQFKGKCFNISLKWYKKSWEINQDGVLKILDEQIDKIRLVCLNTLQIQFAFNKSLSENIKLKEKLNILKNDQNPIIRRNVYYILSEFIDDTSNYQTLFQEFFYDLKENLITNVQDFKLSYINKQANNTSRCKELFTNKIKDEIIEISKEERRNKDIRIFCLDILLLYQQNSIKSSHISSFREDNLLSMIHIIRESKNEELQQSALAIILTQAQKEEILPQSLVNELISIINLLNQNNSNYVIMTLAKISTKVGINNLDLLISHLQNKQVPVEEDGIVEFKERTKQNQDSPNIATMAAKIIVDSISNKSCSYVSNNLLINLIQNLGIEYDKNMRILCAKTLFLISINNLSFFNNENLFNLINFTKDQVRDVQVYSTVVFANELEKQEKINDKNFQYIILIYCGESFILEQKDFSQLINRKVMSCLLKEAEKRDFNEDTFKMIDHAIQQNQLKSNSFQILIKYTASRSIDQPFHNLNRQIPQNTLVIIENQTDDELVIQILINIIQNGQKVGESTVERFIKNLYNSDNSFQRILSFDLLEQIENNQDISDKAFCALEIERAAQYIKKNCEDCSDALHFLKSQSNEGYFLTTESFFALQIIFLKILYSESSKERVIIELNQKFSNCLAFEIVINTLKNHQIIPEFLKESIFQLFLSKKIKQNFDIGYELKIFHDLLVNNQHIPTNVIQKMLKDYQNQDSNMLERDLKQFACFLLILQERGDTLSQQSIDQISNFLMVTNNIPLIERCAKALVNSMSSSSFEWPFSKQSEEACLYCLRQSNINITEIIFEGLKQASLKCELSHEVSQSLLDIMGSNQISNEFAKSIEKVIFSCKSMNMKQMNLIMLRQIKDDNQFLKELQKLLLEDSNISLPDIHLKRLQNILKRTNQDLQVAVIKIMLIALREIEIDQVFIEEVCKLAISTLNYEVQNNCIIFLEDLIKLRRPLSQQNIQHLALRWDSFNIKKIIKLAMNCYSFSIDINLTNFNIEEIEGIIQKLKQRLRSFDEIPSEYIHAISRNIYLKIDKETIQKVFNCIKQINSLDEFEQLIRFIKENKLKSKDIISLQNLSLEELKKGLCIKVLNNQLSYPYDRFQFSTLVDHIMEIGWEFQAIKELLMYTQSEVERVSQAKHEQLIEVFQSIQNYQLPFYEFNSISEILSEQDQSDWNSAVHQIAIGFKFQENVIIKNQEQIISEFYEINQQHMADEGLLQYENIKKEFLDIKALIKEHEDKEYEEEEIEDDDTKENKKAQFQERIRLFKNDPKDHFLIVLVEIRKAIVQLYGFQLTDTQILSCIVTIEQLKSPSNIKKGIILQVATGEGKSFIVCIIAIILALQNKKVDIITSSPILAERDVDDKKKLYQKFDISVSCNRDKSLYIKGPKDCYKKDVVYGEASQFQFDILRDEYSQLNTLAGRKIDFAMADEVDSMLIDDSSKICKLSSSVAGIDQLQPIYFFIWCRIYMMLEKIIEIDGLIVLVFGKLKHHENGQISLKYIDEEMNQQYLIEDLYSYFQQYKDISKIGKIIDESIEVFLQNHLEEYIKDIIEQKVIRIQNCFKEYVNLQVKKWIQSAITAIVYEENVHYIIDKGQIKPVDFDNTGIVQNSTNWSDGLHQFLQLKHGLKVTSETFTTNFLSNVGYFKKYNHLIGLTGTLGSKMAKKVLSEVYKVELAYIPSKCQKQYVEFDPIICTNKENWVSQICTSAIKEASKDFRKRGVLIICQTISFAESIITNLKIKYFSNCIKSYVLSDMNQEKEVEKIRSGEIIVATNLAGRGTDIKTDEIQKFGGMHVILTFIPNNQRVEDQAFGRTSRQGSCGTSILIVNYEDLEVVFGYEKIQSLKQEGNQEDSNPLSLVGPQYIKEVRNKFEIENLTNFMEKDLENINFKDKLFISFCSLMKKARENIQSKDSTFQKIKSSVGGCFVNINPSSLEINTLAALEDRWAIFLKKNEDNEIEKAESNFEEFKKEIEIDITHENLIKNSYYFINIANDNLRSSSWTFDCKKTEQLINQGISLDQDLILAGYAAKSWLLIKSLTKDAKTQKNRRYKKLVIQEYNKALTISAQEISTLGALKAIIVNQFCHEDTCDLFKQIEEKVNILATYMNSIENSIKQIIKSQRLIQIKWQKNNLVSFSSIIQSFVGITQPSDLVSFEEFSLGRCEKEEVLTFLNQNFKEQQELDQSIKFSIGISDLTSYEDQGTQDQAINQIKLFDKFRLKYKIDLILKELNAVGIKKLYDDPKIKKYLFDAKIKQVSLSELLIIAKQLQEKNRMMNIEVQGNNMQLLQVIQRLEENLLTEKIKLIQKVEEIDLIHSQCLNLNQLKERLLHSVNQERISFFASKFIIKYLFNDNSEQQLQIISVLIPQINDFSYEQIESFQITKILFRDLEQSDAKKIIPFFRKQEIEFDLIFAGITGIDCQKIIPLCEQITIDQEDIEILDVRKLSEQYERAFAPTNELQEFSVRGIEYILNTSEKKFIPWNSIFVVGILSALQLGTGVILISTGFGAQVGMGLIVEGVADLIIAFNVYYNRSFSWKDYALQKGMSLVSSAISMGWSKLKDSAKGVKNLISGVGKQQLANAGQKISQIGVIETEGKISSQIISSGQTLIKSGQNLKSLAIKQIGVTLCEATAQQGLSYLSHQLINEIMHQLSSKIQSYFESKIGSNLIDNESFMKVIRKMYTLDKMNNSHEQEIKIQSLLENSQNPQSSQMEQVFKQLKPVAPLILKYFLSKVNLKKEISDIGCIAIELSFLFQSVKEISAMIAASCEMICSEFSSYDKSNLNLDQIIQNQFAGIQIEKVRQLLQGLANSERLQEHSVFNVGKNVKGSNDDGIEGVLEMQEYELIEFIEKFDKIFLSFEFSKSSKIFKDGGKLFTNNMIAKIKDIIRPISNLACNSIVNNLSKKIQNNWITNREQDTSQQREDQKRYQNLKDQKLSKEDLQFFKDYDPSNTISKQINYNAKDYIIAYSQCEIYYHLTQKNENKKQVTNKPSNNCISLADNIRKDCPADIKDKTIIDKFQGINRFEVQISEAQYDDPNFMNELKMDLNDQVVVLNITKKQGNKSIRGYDVLLQKDGQIYDPSFHSISGSNSSYAVALKMKQIDVNLENIQILRHKVADEVQNNPAVQKAILIMDDIKIRFPNEAGRILRETVDDWKITNSLDLQLNEHREELEKILVENEEYQDEQEECDEEQEE